MMPGSEVNTWLYLHIIPLHMRYLPVPQKKNNLVLPWYALGRRVVGPSESTDFFNTLREIVRL